VLSREAAGLVANILSDDGARRPGFPAGGPLDFDYAVGIKTGTSQGYRDAWAAAFSDRLLVVTWVGNHDWKRMNSVSGGIVAAPAAHAILDTLMPHRHPAEPWTTSFAPPAGLVSRDVCALSGRLPGPGCTHLKTELFLPGTEPHEPCPFHVEVSVDTRNGLLAGPACPRAFVRTAPMLALPETYASWAAKQHLAIAPTAESPLCPTAKVTPRVAIREPRTNARFLFDPDTPRELSTVHFQAQVSPANEEVVWLVDGTPVAQVAWPHDLRWPMTKGTHVVKARLAHSAEASRPVTIVVDD
jgi:penicillin-binding protein 1C